MQFDKHAVANNPLCCQKRGASCGPLVGTGENSDEDEEKQAWGHLYHEWRALRFRGSASSRGRSPAQEMSGEKQMLIEQLRGVGSFGEKPSHCKGKGNADHSSDSAP